MTFEAIPAAAPPAAAARGSDGLRTAWRVLLVTRVAVLLVAIFAALSFGPATGGLAEENAQKFDDPALSAPLGGAGETLLSPLARWDSIWYLRIARSGYADSEVRAAFFPLYPLLSRGLAELGGGSAAALLIAAYLVSLAAFLGALVLLHRLAALELGHRLAAPTVLLLAVFPGALFFGAPYSESLFLLASAGAFYAARTGHWAWAAAAAAAASATRSAGLVLLLPLALFWWTSRPRRPHDAAWLLLVPLGTAAYAAFLGLAEGDALRFLEVQDAWSREFAGPLVGAWDGLGAAVDGVRQLASGQRSHVYFEQAGGDPYRVAAINIILVGFLAFAAVAVVGVWRRLPRPYAVYLVAALALPLSFPVEPQPLMSLPRFLAVLFPIFMWLALVCEERRSTDLAVAASALGLGLFTAQYASWHFIS
ncbi:MAG TPA: mannosyltransferase family protein [Thermoleophilaceae bacterium]|nr:mannosyltransferase family protein [Thermoleophilaceae bacterium]